jgi:hypothetical protein
MENGGTACMPRPNTDGLGTYGDEQEYKTALVGWLLHHRCGYRRARQVSRWEDLGEDLAMLAAPAIAPGSCPLVPLRHRPHHQATLGQKMMIAHIWSAWRTRLLMHNARRCLRSAERQVHALLHGPQLTGSSFLAGSRGVCVHVCTTRLLIG